MNCRLQIADRRFQIDRLIATAGSQPPAPPLLAAKSRGSAGLSLKRRGLRSSTAPRSRLPTLRTYWVVLATFALLTSPASGHTVGVTIQDSARIDYLTFAQGAIPVRVSGAGAALGADYEDALRIIDGNPTKFTVILRADDATATEFVYELPALTTFDRFAVPDVRETPSPSQTFTRRVDIAGSSSGPDGDYIPLASATLKRHRSRGEVTEIRVLASPSVKLIKLTLTGGMEVLTETFSAEFSEIVGNGTQQPAAFVDHFRGIWQGRGVLIELKQDGPTVSGCYDRNGELNGTVSGNILKATGVTRDAGIVSAFILSVSDSGVLRGVRSTNRAPFTLYTGPAAPQGTRTHCSEYPPPTLGCGSVIHGINFNFDSADIRPESEPILAELYAGLRDDPSATITIEGHTSSEGSDSYNLDLSERRAQSVVDDLLRRGLESNRIGAVGRGESNPIASNDDENGRSLNRRVEVHCG